MHICGHACGQTCGLLWMTHALGGGVGRGCYTVRCGGYKTFAATRTRQQHLLLPFCGQADVVGAAAQPNECEGGSDETQNTR